MFKAIKAIFRFFTSLFVDGEKISNNLLLSGVVVSGDFLRDTVAESAKANLAFAKEMSSDAELKKAFDAIMTELQSVNQ